MRKITLKLVMLVFLLSLAAHSSDLTIKSSVNRDNYHLYYNNYSLSINNLSSPVGTISWEGFYDDLGLSSELNGINTFNAPLVGSRLYLNHHWNNLYYMMGIGNDNFQDLKHNLFYDLSLAYLIPLDSQIHMVLNARTSRSRFQHNPFALYLGIPNNTTSLSLQLKMPVFYLQATYESNALKEALVPEEMLVNTGLIETIPGNTLHSFYIYGYIPLVKNLSTGLVYSTANSEINVFQPTYRSVTQNLYTFFPYFTPIESKALSILVFGNKDLNVGTRNLGTFSFKAQVPIVSSTKLLYEVKEGFITPADSVYYDYSGVEPLKIELAWSKKIAASGLSLTMAYEYFDKPYIKNQYFADNQTGYKNHQFALTISKSLF